MAALKSELQETMEKIDNIVTSPMENSQYLKPVRINYTQNKIQRFWDLFKGHNSVAILIFNKSRNVLVLVKQFRPAVFFGAGCGLNEDETLVDWSKIPPEKGICLEVCAGVMDKPNLSPAETAREEVLEECGYDVPLEKLEFISKMKADVGYSGSSMYFFYLEVEDTMKVNQGGGLVEEGELIETVEMSIPEIIDYINQKDITSPPSFAYIIMWFLANRKP